VIIRGGTFGPVATNTYVVADDQGGSAIIVDPAMGSSAWVADTLARLEATAIAVFDTHGHWDHIVENYVWAEQGMPVWVSPGDQDWLAAPAPFNPAIFGNPPPLPGCTPSRLVDDGDIIEVGSASFRLLATPGHSPGCLVAYCEAEGEALVGDLVFAQGIGRTDFPRSDHTAMLTSLERVFTDLPAETRIYPGHGEWAVTLGSAEPWARMFM
jgi:glyoxylase-like metal-dependent hydrolase (beta-lactamase superfamily II)